MPEIISANDAKNRLGTSLGYANEQGEEVVIERHGKPRAVIMSIEAFQEVEELRDQKRRVDAIWELRVLRNEDSSRDRDLTEEQIEEIANRFSRDISDDMAAEGKFVVERDFRDCG